MWIDLFILKVWSVIFIVAASDPVESSANIQMAFLLPLEFRALADQEVYLDFDELSMRR